MTIIHCLGSGLVGSFVIKKLLEEKMKINLIDIEDKGKFSNNDYLTIHVTDAIEYCKNTSENDEIYVNMLPGFLGFKATEILVSRGKKVIDLSFSETTPDSLNQKAIDSGARIIGGCCGASPNHIAMMRKTIDNYVKSEVPSLEEIERHLGPVTSGAKAQMRGDLSIAGGAAGPGSRNSRRSRRR